jgi:DNA-binding transcriptional MerR regulator
VVQTSLSIGDFARATHMSIKTLRHYHQVGLLKPADVDSVTGYRRYTTDQIPTAQVIRRFRDLDMPLSPNSQVRVRHLPEKFHSSGRDK